MKKVATIRLLDPIGFVLNKITNRRPDEIKINENKLKFNIGFFHTYNFHFRDVLAAEHFLKYL